MIPFVNLSTPYLRVASRACAAAMMRTVVAAMVAIAFGLALVTLGAAGQTSNKDWGADRLMQLDSECVGWGDLARGQRGYFVHGDRLLSCGDLLARRC